jgi:hypothetical protein
MGYTALNDRMTVNYGDEERGEFRRIRGKISEFARWNSENLRKTYLRFEVLMAMRMTMFFWLQP